MGVYPAMASWFNMWKLSVIYPLQSYQSIWQKLLIPLHDKYPQQIRNRKELLNLDKQQTENIQITCHVMLKAWNSDSHSHCFARHPSVAIHRLSFLPRPSVALCCPRTLRPTKLQPTQCPFPKPESHASPSEKKNIRKCEDWDLGSLWRQGPSREAPSGMYHSQHQLLPLKIQLNWISKWSWPYSPAPKDTGFSSGSWKSSRYHKTHTGRKSPYRTESGRDKRRIRGQSGLEGRCLSWALRTEEWAGLHSPRSSGVNSWNK